MRICLFLSCIIIFSSCSTLLKVSYGIKNPDVENVQTLKKYVNKKDFDIQEFYGFKDSASFVSYLQAKIGLPEARFFNKDHYLVRYKADSVNCNAKVFQFLEHPESLIKLEPDPNISMESFLENVVDLKTGAPFHMENGPYEMYAVIYWARWIGKLNKTKVQDWIDQANAAHEKGYQIKIIPVNTDIQDFWGMKKLKIGKMKPEN